MLTDKTDALLNILILLHELDAHKSPWGRGRDHFSVVNVDQILRTLRARAQVDNKRVNKNWPIVFVRQLHRRINQYADCCRAGLITHKAQENVFLRRKKCKNRARAKLQMRFVCVLHAFCYLAAVLKLLTQIAVELTDIIYICIIYCRLLWPFDCRCNINASTFTKGSAGAAY